jgi:hypothetical protein
MSDQELKREYRRLSPAERARHARLAKEIEREFPPGAATPHDEPMPATLGEYYDLRAAAAELRKAREDRNLSLSKIEEATGIGADRLRRIEDGDDLDPSLAVLSRYASAVGKSLRVVIGDASQPADAAEP